MQDLFQKIQTQYSLDKIIKSNKVRKGVLSHNLTIIDRKNKKYFLKQYRLSEENEIKKICVARNFFAKKGVPALMPIKTVKKKEFFTFDKKIYSLFPFINGKILQRLKMPTWSLKELALMLAKMHKIGHKQILIKPKKQKELSSMPQKTNFILSLILKKPRKNNFDKKAIKVLKLKTILQQKYLKRLKENNLKKETLIHGDFHEENIFFRNKKIYKIFDFEKISYSNRVYELVRSVDYMCLQGQTNEKNLKKGRFYLNEYKKYYSFKKNELQKALNFFYLGQIFSLWLEEEYYLKQNYRVAKFLPPKYRKLLLLKNENKFNKFVNNLL